MAILGSFTMLEMNLMDAVSLQTPVILGAGDGTRTHDVQLGKLTYPSNCHFRNTFNFNA